MSAIQYLHENVIVTRAYMQLLLRRIPGIFKLIHTPDLLCLFLRLNRHPNRPACNGTFEQKLSQSVWSRFFKFGQPRHKCVPAFDILSEGARFDRCAC